MAMMLLLITVVYAELAQKDKQFNSLTDTAGELMSLGFEDIYTDSRDAIAANLLRYQKCLPFPVCSKAFANCA